MMQKKQVCLHSEENPPTLLKTREAKRKSHNRKAEANTPMLFHHEGRPSKTDGTIGSWLGGTLIHAWGGNKTSRRGPSPQNCKISLRPKGGGN